MIFINSLISSPLLLKRGSSSCWIVSKLWVFGRRWGSHIGQAASLSQGLMERQGAIGTMWCYYQVQHLQVFGHVSSVLMSQWPQTPGDQRGSADMSSCFSCNLFPNHLERRVAFSPTSSGNTGFTQRASTEWLSRVISIYISVNMSLHTSLTHTHISAVCSVCKPNWMSWCCRQTSLNSIVVQSVCQYEIQGLKKRISFVCFVCFFFCFFWNRNEGQFAFKEVLENTTSWENKEMEIFWKHLHDHFCVSGFTSLLDVNTMQKCNSHKRTINDYVNIAI